MDATQFFVQQRLRTVVSACEQAVARIAHARSIAELPNLMRVSCESYLRQLARRDLQRVKDAAEARVRQLLQPEIDRLQAAGVDQNAQVQRLRQIQHSLRGHFPAQFHDVERALAAANRRQAPPQSPSA